MKTSVKHGKVNSLVVCSRSGDDGCKANCSHRTPHVEHEPYQTDCDDYNPCSMAGLCYYVCGTVRCLPHNDQQHLEQNKQRRMTWEKSMTKEKSYTL